MKNNYIVFDVETTGLPKRYNASPKLFDLWPHIVQFSWILKQKNETCEKSFIIKPDGYVIPEDSTKIHKITNDYAVQHGSPIEEVLEEFIKDCDKADFFVAHNASFDVSVVKATFYRNKMDLSPIGNKKVFCTMKSTTNICKIPGKYGNKYPKLEELYFYLFKEKPNNVLHNALEDSRVTLMCYEQLVSRGIM